MARDRASAPPTLLYPQIDRKDRGPGTLRQASTIKTSKASRTRAMAPARMAATT